MLTICVEYIEVTKAISDVVPRPTAAATTETRDDDDDDDDDGDVFGPKPLPKAELGESAKYGEKHKMNKGEGEAMALFVQQQKRIPRRGTLHLADSLVFLPPPPALNPLRRDRFDFNQDRTI